MVAVKLCVVLLARSGDIVNSLGFCKHLHDDGNSVDFIVDVRFKSVLLGVSYVTPVPVQFGLEAVPKAMQFAEGKYDSVLLAQTYGKHWTGSRAHSYNVESWRNCGYSVEQFHNLDAFPLVFDRRDLDREKFLCECHIQGRKPLLLLSIGCGKSSPFSAHHVLTESIHRRWGRHCDILNLCDVRAARLYDLLVIFQKASLLITGDTAALHLAAAVPTLPVIALVNNTPFLATTPRCRTLGVVRYADALRRASAIHAWVGQGLALSEQESASRAGSGLGLSPAAA